MVDFLSFFYFLIFIGNAFFYSYFSFKSIKSNIDLFRNVQKDYLIKKNFESKISSLFYRLLLENTIICVYIADILDNYYNKILILRVIFVIGGILCERCEISKEVIYEKIGHGFLLSFLVIPLSPFNSFLIHFVDSMLIIIFDKYFHEVWNMEKKNR